MAVLKEAKETRGRGAKRHLLDRIVLTVATLLRHSQGIGTADSQKKKNELHVLIDNIICWRLEYLLLGSIFVEVDSSSR